MSRTPMPLTVVIHTRNRVVPLRKCLQSLFTQNFTDFDVVIYDDGSDKLNVKNELSGEFPQPNITWLRGEKALGLTPARNYTLRQATGDIVLGLDDDAYFTTPDFLGRLVDHFAKHPEHAALAPKIIDMQNGVETLMVPFTRRKRQDDPAIVDRAQYVSYYAGPCYAIRRTALEAVDFLSLKTSYGEDEVDLSYRLVRAGFTIYYRPDLVAIHDPERRREGRVLNLSAHIENRVYLAYQYLPFPNALSYVAIWLVYYSVKALTVPSTGFANLYKSLFKALCQMRKDYERDPLRPAALAYLTEHHGRVWY